MDEEQAANAKEAVSSFDETVNVIFEEGNSVEGSEDVQLKT